MFLEVSVFAGAYPAFFGLFDIMMHGEVAPCTYCFFRSLKKIRSSYAYITKFHSKNPCFSLKVFLYNEIWSSGASSATFNFMGTADGVIEDVDVAGKRNLFHLSKQIQSVHDKIQLNRQRNRISPGNFNWFTNNEIYPDDLLTGLAKGLLYIFSRS